MGGAAIAANRLMHALNANGAHATMLSRHNLRLPFWKEKWGGVPFLLERLRIFLAAGMSTKGLFAVDIANIGDNIVDTPAFRNADVIHLHWVNQGFVSLNTLRKIIHSGKRIVWTMHDQWCMTAICHYSDECRKYESGCRDCPLLPRGVLGDVAQTVFNKKKKIYSEGSITFVTCSQWLCRMAQASALAKGQRVVSIPNPIDTTVFSPRNRGEARQQLGLETSGTKILFGCQKVTDERKGLRYLIEAMSQLPDVEVLLVGGNATDTMALMPDNVKCVAIGQVSDTAKMAMLYAAADAFVTPSLQDNLPNTIMESMACGTPCVGFNVGGIPEMIDHEENGYVAEYKNAKSLAEGIRYVTAKENVQRLAQAARAKVLRCYSESAVAKRYMEIYRESNQ